MRLNFLNIRVKSADLISTEVKFLYIGTATGTVQVTFNGISKLTVRNYLRLVHKFRRLQLSPLLILKTLQSPVYFPCFAEDGHKKSAIVVVMGQEAHAVAQILAGGTRLCKHLAANLRPEVHRNRVKVCILGHVCVKDLPAG